MTELRIIARAVLSEYDHDEQLNMMTEEAAELIAAINKWRRGRIPDSEIISEIADGNTAAANNRYAALGAVYFFLGFLSGAVSLLATVRAEVVNLMPTVFTEVDAQTANMLNILVPER